MNDHLRNIATKASRDVDLVYMGDAYARSLTKAIIKDLTDDLSKIKWVGDDDGWNKAIDAVKAELKKRYGV